MYVFISYSSTDNEFAQSLSRSIEFYGVQFFLDQRDIKIGDDIPGKIYDALERATHFIHILSIHSVQSPWVKEELSVAKMKQLSERGCRIFPLIIDDAKLPTPLRHIKYGDFRNWRMREEYARSLRQLLDSMEVVTDWASAGATLTGYMAQIAGLNRVATCAAFLRSTYFQLERVWFAALDQSEHRAQRWFGDTIRREGEVKWLKGEAETWWKQLVVQFGPGLLRQSACESALYAVIGDVTYCQSNPIEYERISHSEDRAGELESIARSIFLELELALAVGASGVSTEAIGTSDVPPETGRTGE